MKILVTGATGFIGKPLCAKFVQAGHSVTALSRDAKRAAETLGPQVKSLEWGGTAGGEWKQAVAESDCVVHLAGESVGGARWTPEFKAKIRSSRVETTRTLVDAIRQAATKPSALVSASAVGYYGDRSDEKLTEESPPGQDFLAKVCAEWEGEVEKAKEAGLRVAMLRIGIVLGAGGALEKMLQPLPVPISPWKLGLGGPMGSGRQWMSWIQQEDVVGLFFWAATNTAVSGAVNAVSPTPVTNADFSHALGRALHRPSFLPLPGFALRLIVGEFAESLLGGQRVYPAVAQKLGYVFKYTDVDTALRSVIGK